MLVINEQLNKTSELRKQLETESAKKNPDYRRLREISEEIARLENNDMEIDVERISRNIVKKAKIRKQRRLKKFVTASSVCVVLVIGVNLYTTSVLGTNVLSSAIRLVENGFSVNFEDTPETELHFTESADDSYGIGAKCAEYGLSPEIPHYIPDGFDLNHFEGYSNYLYFQYKKGNAELTVSYQVFENGEEIPEIGIPSDEHDIIEKQINGRYTVISWENNQFSALFHVGDTVYTVFTENIDYDESEKIVKSIY